MTNLKKKAAIAIASNDLTLIRELRRAVDNKRQKLSELDEAILEATDDDSLFEQELVRADEEQLSCGVWIEKLQDALRASSDRSEFEPDQLRAKVDFEEKPQLKAIGDRIEATAREADVGPLQLTPAIDRTADDLDRLSLSGRTDYSEVHESASAVHRSFSWSGTRVKLPKLTLKTFSGDLGEWMPFWDSFSSAVDENAQLAPVDKFNYLRGLLTGKAADAIAGLSLTATNYDEALGILRKRYGDPQRIIGKHMEALLNLDAVEKSGSVERLRNLFDKVETQVRSLRALGVESTTYGTLLSSVILNKLPAEVRLIIHRAAREKGHIPVDDLMLLFEQELHARERSNTVTKSEPRTSSALSQDRRRDGTRNISSTHCFRVSVSVEEAKRMLATLPVEERRQYTLDHGLCWNCLWSHHRSSQCRRPAQCTKCKRRHHELLHDAFHDAPAAQPSASSGSSIRTFGCRANRGNETVQLMTTVAEVAGERRARVRTFIDLGSQASFVSEALVDAIKPKLIKIEDVRVSAFGSSPVVNRMELYEVSLKTADGNTVVHAWKKEALAVDIEAVPSALVEQWRNEGVDLTDAAKADVDPGIHVLLGAEVANDLLLERTVSSRGETAWKTKIGWVLSGKRALQPMEAAARNTSVAYCDVRTMEEQVERLWAVEELPFQRDKNSQPCFPMKKIEGHYEVGLMWKGVERPEDNRQSATAIAAKMAEKMDMRGSRESYESVLLDEYQQLEAIEAEPEPETEGYYLPHHAVIREEATTTKTRVVFNASAAKKNEKSLNDTIDAGPSLLPDLVGLLIRFRELPAAVQADIRKAFFMIGVRKEDRRYLRFVWPNQEGQMITRRLRKLPFGVNCSPHILSAVVQHHLEEEKQSRPAEEVEALELLRKSLYVDDCITSLSTDQDVAHFKQVSTASLRNAGMDLRKWRGNTLEKNAEAGEKVLGIIWDTDTDTISMVCGVNDRRGSDPWTRRRLLGAVATLFDPLGLISATHLTGKILLQRAWQETSGWDEPLSPQLASCVESWWGELQRVSGVRFPRWIEAQIDTPVEVHVFADASEKAYGCCLYVVVDGVSHLVYAKTKVAPLKSLTLPRLELQAAVLAVTRLQFVATSLRLEISRITAWSDSMTALQWISGDALRWKTWVRNRVQEIQEISQKLGVSWRHCPGLANPADLASRGGPVSSVSSDLWQHGPEWLPNEDAWPATVGLVTGEQDGEEAECERRTVSVNAACSQSSEPEWYVRISQWPRLIGVARRILMWRNWKDPLPDGKLQEKAAELLYRMVQKDVFPEELGCLQAGGKIPTTSRLYQFKPRLDNDGLIRVGGRLDRSDLPEATKHLVLLAGHHLTNAMLRDCHVQSLHQGVETVLASVREKFCIIGDRRLLRNIKHHCVKCRRYDARPADEESTDLPADRVDFQRPFSLCGVDYAGPLLVKVGAGVKKVWIALFVCGTTRAVHLEVVESLSVDDFLLAWRRFVSRRSTPRRVRSDNGTTFVAAAKVLRIHWIFNPPAAPWFGGFYERLVRVVKTPLKKVLGKALLRPAELVTVLCEIEQAVNKRPLTHVGALLEGQPLTPAKLIGMDIWPVEVQLPDDDLAVNVTARQLTHRMRYVRTVADHLRKRWRQEYLVTLNAHHSGQSRPVQCGDVVFVMDGGRKQFWRMARVVQLLPGRDGKHRVAMIDTGGATTLRPIKKLVPMEVVSKSDDEDGSTDNPPAPTQQQVVPEVQTSPVTRRTRTRVVHAPSRLNL